MPRTLAKSWKVVSKAFKSLCRRAASPLLPLVPDYWQIGCRFSDASPFAEREEVHSLLYLRPRGQRSHRLEDVPARRSRL